MKTVGKKVVKVLSIVSWIVLVASVIVMLTQSGIIAASGLLLSILVSILIEYLRHCGEQDEETD